MHLVITPPTAGLARQRMVKVGNYTTPASWTLVTGWGPDDDAPATVSSNGLLVTGSGEAQISVNAPISTSAQGAVVKIRIKVDGTIVWTSSSASGGTISHTAIAEVSDGTRITLEALGDWGSESVRAGSWIEVAPA